MRIFFFNPVYIEPWDWRVIEKGVGGSETSAIEMTQRFAHRGYDVTCYTRLPDDCPDIEYEGVHWRDLDEVDLNQDGLWVVYRSLACMDEFCPSEKRKAWLMCEDLDYLDWTPSRAEKFDRIFGLSKRHVRHLQENHLESLHRIELSGNGIRTNKIMSLPQEERNPKRLIYSSSPDRALNELLWIFKRAREIVKELELHVFYGLDNIDKMTKNSRDCGFWKKTRDTVVKVKSTPGVIWHGRCGQTELYREYLKSGIWCYPTWFSETSCITAMEAQALGAIPITRPYWGLGHNVDYGVFIEGSVDDKLVLCRYVDAVCQIATSNNSDILRQTMMINSRARHNYERICDVWESLILSTFCSEDFPRLPNTAGQAAFQHRYSRGKILNIGCNDDGFGFKIRGAINIDVVRQDIITGAIIPADIIADARSLPESLHNQFDSVILGDILEHMDDDDAVLSIRQSKLCLRGGGKIIITVPEDYRDTPLNERSTYEYAPGIRNYHSRPITKNILEKWIKDAGVRIHIIQQYDYLPYYIGWGVVCS